MSGTGREALSEFREHITLGELCALCGIVYPRRFWRFYTKWAATTSDEERTALMRKISSTKRKEYHEWSAIVKEIAKEYRLIHSDRIRAMQEEKDRKKKNE